MLKVQLLSDTAILPTVATPGEDIGYDLYASEDLEIAPLSLGVVKTGIAIEFAQPKAGALIKCRSSMAKINASVEGGVIDAGYRGEVMVMLRNNDPIAKMAIKRGSKVAQMIEHRLLAGRVRKVEQLSKAKRGEKGFGSSGK